MSLGAMPVRSGGQKLEVPVTGVILAGGEGRRMGNVSKSLLLLDDRPIIGHVVGRFGPQVSRLSINSNRDDESYRAYGVPVVEDSVPSLPGPLAGVLAAMEWMHAQPDRKDRPQWLVSVPADSPFLPDDLVARLLTAATEHDAMIAYAIRGGLRSPLFALWSTALRYDLRRQLGVGQRKVSAFQQRHRCVAVPFDESEADPFFNINTPEDLEAARRLARDLRNPQASRGTE